MKRITILIGLLALLFSQYQVLLGQTAYPDPVVIQDLYGRVNSLRARRGLPPLSFNTALITAAQGQADWLVATGIRTHIRPDGNRPSTRAKAAGYVTDDWCCGENYYMSIDATPDMVWNFWVWSPHHYANLVNPRFDEIGIGMATNGTRFSYVMVFGNAPDPAAPLQPALEPTAATISFQTQGEYVVQQGDTLMRIAQRFGMSPDVLAGANGITNPALIYPGQRLVVPGTSTTSVAPVTTNPVLVAAPQNPTPVPVAAMVSGEQTTHTVQPGENLFRIALHYGASIQAIMSANGIGDPSLIYVGQQLVIPAGGNVSSGSTQTSTNAGQSGQCGALQATSPLDGFHNGPTRFYWDPASIGVNGYQVEVFNSSGQLVATFQVDGNSTNLTGDTSTDQIGPGLTFGWEVAALLNGQVACTSQRVTAPRENSAP
jgi:LysM repeat protein